MKQDKIRAAFEAQIDYDMEQQREAIDNVYTQRNALAVAFAKAALAAGWGAGRGIDSDPSKVWDGGWRHVVYVDLPNGQQVSWHMSPDCVALLDGLPQYKGVWDGSYVARDPNWCAFAHAPQPTKPAPFDEKDTIITTYSPETKSGWVHKQDIGVRIVHLPTGLKAESHAHQTVQQNRISAMAMLQRLVTLKKPTKQEEAVAYVPVRLSKESNRVVDGTPMWDQVYEAGGYTYPGPKRPLYFNAPPQPAEPVHIVVDWTVGNSPVFVEVETPEGKSVDITPWHDRPDGYKELRLFTAPPQPAEPDYKHLYEQMCERCDYLDAKLAEYSEQAVLQSLPVQTSSAIRGDSYAGVYIWLGNDHILQHIPKLLAENANDPQNMLDVVASECIKKLERHNVLQSPEIQALRKDAERYRHIREGNQWVVAATQMGFHVEGERLDGLIDAVIEQQT